MDHSRTRLDSLTSMRFGAALLVVLSHTTKDLAPVPGLGLVALGGGAGVGFFFALSGFVLSWSHRPGDRPTRFYRRRFARVYPLHLLTYLLAYPVLLLAGTNMSGSSVNLAAALTSPVLLQAWFPQPAIHYGMNAPSWSLSDEAFFYLAAPLLFPLLPRLGLSALRTWLIALPAGILVTAAVLSLTLQDRLGDVLYVNPLWRIGAFIAGMLLAEEVRRGLRPPLGLRAAIAVALLGYLLLPVIAHVAKVIGAPALAASGVSDGLMLPLFLLLIAAGARSDLERTDRWIAKRPLLALGDWSFALYLTHWLLIDLVVGVLPGVRLLSPIAAAAANLGAVVLAILVAAACYRCVERPLERRLRGTRPRAEETAPTAAASGS